MLNDPSAKLGAAGAIDMGAMGDQTTALKHLTAIGNALGNKAKTKESLISKKQNLQETKRWQKLAGITK